MGVRLPPGSPEQKQVPPFTRDFANWLPLRSRQLNGSSSTPSGVATQSASLVSQGFRQPAPAPAPHYAKTARVEGPSSLMPANPLKMYFSFLFSTSEGRVPAGSTFPVNLSEVLAISTGPQVMQYLCFQCFRNGKPDATFYARRSGAQRGALGNNLGKRFSWAPLAYLAPQNGPPPLRP